MILASFDSQSIFLNGFFNKFIDLFMNDIHQRVFSECGEQEGVCAMWVCMNRRLNEYG
jgi:hypothetical protein